MNSEELRNKCSAFELKENRIAIFNRNYSSFIINYSFYKWHPDYTVFIVRMSNVVEIEKAFPSEGKVGCEAIRMRWNT